MPTRKPPAETGYAALKTSIDAVIKSVDGIAVKLDGVTAIAMSMSNEIARLDERVTFALEQQKGQAANIANIERRITKLEGYDQSDSRMKELGMRLLLIIVSAVVTGVVMYIVNAPQ